MKVFFGLGSNLGGREAPLWGALERLRARVSGLVASPFYETRPVGAIEQPAFLNLVAGGAWDGSVADLLTFVKRIETDLGRQPRERFGPREIDIDLLWTDGPAVSTPGLTLPHPRLSERLFVLRPFADLAPGLRIGDGPQTVEERAQALETADPAACRFHLPTIPLTELSPWWVRRALEHMGAFVLTGAFPPDLAEALIREVRLQLRRPSEEKRRFDKIDPCSAGYTRPGVERVGRHAPDTERECWDVLTPRRRLNAFPDDAPRFRLLTEAAHEILEGVAQACFLQLDRAFGTSIARDAGEGDHMLRCTRYLAGGDPARVLFPEHDDFGLLSLYGGGAAPGLEAEYAGRWRPLPALQTPGNVIVGAGNLLKLYLPTARKAFHHRVTAAHDGDEERVSYSLFTEPNPDAILPNGQRAGERLRKSVQAIRLGS